ncbi:Oidioi.mRNA.OKI2018_I69.XSR.g15803.t1.cds [Oikopleura dioica]|uniref:Oidioi.mRNA.OKI2018_I69.XSR.g15803.t1.cds n=1 Tax=Oikopleura dioica TaxID=34765 RepID=A0ABN7SJ54_OIKDI|nr:Oidioi.mRNA.OKI2018_I69.XSR.g15803.t1.cds [Oikopleura dioica]
MGSQPELTQKSEVVPEMENKEVAQPKSDSQPAPSSQPETAEVKQLSQKMTELSSQEKPDEETVAGEGAIVENGGNSRVDCGGFDVEGWRFWDDASTNPSSQEGYQLRWGKTDSMAKKRARTGNPYQRINEGTQTSPKKAHQDSFSQTGSSLFGEEEDPQLPESLGQVIPSPADEGENTMKAPEAPEEKEDVLEANAGKSQEENEKSAKAESQK